MKEMKNFTKLHAEMHRCTISRLSEVNSDLKEILRKSKFLDKAKEILIAKLEEIPSGNTLFHMDYHPDNIMKTDRGLIVIDWITAGMVNPHAGVARTLYILKKGAPMSDLPTLTKLVIKVFQLSVSRIYFKTYKKLIRISKKDLKEWKIIIQSARLSENIPEERHFILKKLKNYFRKI
jgi:hypothetical protein